MYEELTKALRKQAHDLPEKFSRNAENINLFLKAADAIEALEIKAETFKSAYIAEHNARIDEIKRNMWIPAAVRLPDKYASVWTYSKFGMLQDEYIGEYDGENYFARQTTHVTHWMPLPEPPKEDA